MTARATQPLMTPILPDNAPFSAEQRAWLNGFFAGIFSADAAPVTALSNADASALIGNAAEAARPGVPLDDGDDGEAPWHDPALPLDERLALAEGRPLRRRLMAAMAQQDCGQCGYTCEDYSNALASRAEDRLNLCVPGGKDTARMLKRLAAEIPAPAPPAAAAMASPAVMTGREAGAPLADMSVAGEGAGLEQRGFSRDNPTIAAFLSRTRLNAEGSGKETNHIEFDLAPGRAAYEPGDSFGVFAGNAPALVKAIAEHLGLPVDEPISAGGTTRSLWDWLSHGKSLAPAPDALFALFSATTPDAKERTRLERMADGENVDGDLADLDVLAVLRKFPHIAPPLHRLIEALDPLQPRLYSISSSPRAAPGRLSLTVDTVRYTIADRLRLGVASTFLADRAQPGDRMRVYVQRSHGFGLPGNPDTPIVMVGPGTGVAPFRAFLQERMATRAAGGAWLFYGHQREATDFFYRDEWLGLQAAGALTRLSTAWSRDGDRKVYVQDRLRAEGAELWSWLERGAHFYVCGDAKRMAKDVDGALHEVIERHGVKSTGQARAIVAALKKAGRYQSDVY